MQVGSDAAFKYKNLLDCTNSNAGASSVRLPMQSLLSLLNQTTTSGQEGAVQCQEMSSSAQEPGMQYQDNSHLAQPREKVIATLSMIYMICLQRVQGVSMRSDVSRNDAS